MLSRSKHKFWHWLCGAVFTEYVTYKSRSMIGNYVWNDYKRHIQKCHMCKEWRVEIQDNLKSKFIRTKWKKREVVMRWLNVFDYNKN